MKRTILKKYNALIGFLLSVLGFGTACSLSSCEYGLPPVEYGTPHATFKVNGSVKSEMTSDQVPGIRVIMGTDTAYTDESGNYQVQTWEFPGDQAFLVQFKDVDGEVNGAYMPLDTLVEFTDPEFTGGDGKWYQGETEKEVNINLKDQE